jgi:thiamine biosynthesis protein ThiS
MEIILNGERKQVGEGLTVAQLLQQLAVTPERVAVEVNLTVLTRAQHPTTLLQEGDRVEIVQIIGGGV